MQGSLAAQQMAEVVVVQATVTDVNTAEGAADELCLNGSSQLQAGQAVADGIDTVGNLDLTAQAADDVSHGSGSDVVHMALVGQGEFVGENDAVHTAVLQGMQVSAGMLNDGVHIGIVTEHGIAGQGIQVEHGNDGFLGAEKLFSPKHNQ